MVAKFSLVWITNGCKDDERRVCALSLAGAVLTKFLIQDIQRQAQSSSRAWCGGTQPEPQRMLMVYAALCLSQF